ncbi:hypothetical protein NCS57_00769400 [Fusarium keratoplasticum]|uniref:Uncharacterized protein n=1 Tax=Fusarium keratoplasticum TaxID=1328300 RepID=A0ACC0R0I3_9HYPO|nr:hypothetical protein NCS57_00769400 [Fusarium keratoplasticum]KAI8669541.1 hypothetical protein NCS57_00769400 [Fusarium keratoplasticum]
MGIQKVEFDILDSDGQKLDVLPVTRVTKARGSALFVTSSAVRLLILYFRYNEHLANPFSNPRTCVKALTMLIFKWTGAREHVFVHKSPVRTDRWPSIRITIAYHNGQRRDAQGEATHVFTKLSDDDDDPYLSTAEYLLNWAVHTGEVEASSMAELRRTISAPSFSHIEWTHPNRPVLCASDQDGELQYDSPAHAHHIESYVRAITKSVPALHDMKCSALRWGSIYEAWEMGRVDAALAMLDECREVDSSAS